MFVAFSVVFVSPFVNAQGAEDFDALKQRVQKFDQAQKYQEALAVQRTLEVEIEKTETASAGRPAAKTVGALVAVAWYARRSML
jgi:hypothetical protein